MLSEKFFLNETKNPPPPPPPPHLQVKWSVPKQDSSEEPFQKETENIQYIRTLSEHI